MLKATRASKWRTRYEIRDGDTPITLWEGNSWSIGGRFELGGETYQIKSIGWRTRYTMTDSRGTVIAEAERVGRKHWAVHADGRTYRFKRDSLLRGGAEQLMDGETVVGQVKRHGWRHDATADLPGLPQLVQLFVLCVVVTNWNAQAAAAA